MSDNTLDDFAELSDDEFMNKAFAAGSPPLPDDIHADQPDGMTAVVEEPVVEAPVPAVVEEVVTEAPKASEKPNHTTPKQTEPEVKPQAPVEGAAAEAPSFEELYGKVMAPFKANGREFKPESPEEAIKLMQLGANYTKKMSKLAPNLKLMRMLENNGLLDESKLNYLIDLNKKDTGAVHRFLKEAKIDPLDIDPNTPVQYNPGNHQVSDNEMAFHEAITTVSDTPMGKETIAHVNEAWDTKSKQMLYQDPQILEVINEQRANGIYTKISAEVDRQRTLGNLVNVPFIQAYHQVGGHLHKAGLLGSPSIAPVTPGLAPVLETRADPVRKQMTNGDKARAASPAPKSAQTEPKSLDPFSPFTMSDAEIMALTNRRF